MHYKLIQDDIEKDIIRGTGTLYYLVNGTNIVVVFDFGVGSFSLPRYRFTLLCNVLNPENRYFSNNNIEDFFSIVELTNEFWNNGTVTPTGYSFLDAWKKEAYNLRELLQREFKINEFLK